MPIDIDISHVARLARLALSHEDLARYRTQLVAILEHAARVQSVDTSGTQPTAHPLGIGNVFRDDQVGASLDREEVLAQAPATRDGYFVVPPALDVG
jgi:aspartyl-tRNA(Asn)/glutamyl-tRNA(Gln) amidotransferase subunit C